MLKRVCQRLRRVLRGLARKLVSWLPRKQRFAVYRSFADCNPAPTSRLVLKIDLLASARGSGPVDGLRWGAALSRISRLTEVPVEELYRRFRPRRGGTQVPHAQQPTQGTPASSGEPRTPDSRDAAERHIMGVLLAEPGRWHEVQTRVQWQDIADETRRELARLYWEHQREEGEPVFSEFLALLKEERLRELAVELVQTVSQFADLGQTLEEAIKHLADAQRKREEQKILAELRQTGERPLVEQDDLLRQLQEKARQPDLRRVGF